MNRLRRWWTRTGVFAREIVAKRVAITTTLGTVLGVLVSADVIPTTWSDVVTKYVGLGLTLAGVLTGALWARAGVTPANPALEPTSNHGSPMVAVYEPRQDGDSQDPAWSRDAPAVRVEPLNYDPKHDVED